MTGKYPLFLTILAAMLAGFLFPQTVNAQDGDLPYWASLRYDEVRMRVGPSREYPIEWIYRRKGLPVKVVRSRDEWDLVEDPEGTRGWIAQSQLSRKRTIMIIGEGLATMFEQPLVNSAIRWRAEPGVVARLLLCRDGWCEIDVAGRTGWVDASRLLGDEELPSQSE